MYVSYFMIYEPSNEWILSFEKLHYFHIYRTLSDWLSEWFLGKHFLQVQPSPGHSEQGFQTTDYKALLQICDSFHEADDLSHSTSLT